MTTENKINIVLLNEKIAAAKENFLRNKTMMSKKERKREIGRINGMISTYNSVIPKSMQYL